jgi:hypothetical protein
MLNSLVLLKKFDAALGRDKALKIKIGDAIGISYAQFQRLLTGEVELKLDDAVTIGKILRIQVIDPHLNDETIDPRTAKAHALVDACPPENLGKLLVAISLVVTDSDQLNRSDTGS